MNLLKDIFNIFYPDICLCCENHLTENETTICLVCRHDLPLTNFSFEDENNVEKAFFGRIKIEKATALFFYIKKGKVQKLIHYLKYKNQQQVGIFIGNWLADEILESDRFKNIDAIIPVPLHKNKLKKRGYNQVTTFGETLASKINAPYFKDILIRASFNKTQTKKVRFDRWKNVQELFYLTNNQYLENKHVLLIDDIITTGATLEACFNELNKTKNIKISIACMAYTK